MSGTLRTVKSSCKFIQVLRYIAFVEHSSDAANRDARDAPKGSRAGRERLFHHARLLILIL
ncbi:hypothetical protein [Brasilonema bromeliae]|uniref:hypothetical protein n=1 Tax=Brasilonema bromeliae TaxID=383615 RepID=UPI00145E8510